MDVETGHNSEARAGAEQDSGGSTTVGQRSNVELDIPVEQISDSTTKKEQGGDTSTSLDQGDNKTTVAEQICDITKAVEATGCCKAAGATGVAMISDLAPSQKQEPEILAPREGCQ